MKKIFEMTLANILIDIIPHCGIIPQKGDNVVSYNFSAPMANLKPSAIRELFKVTGLPGVISFAAGNPSPETFPGKELGELAARILAERADIVLQYGITEGYAPLREAVAERLRNIVRETDMTVIVSGGQQGIELTARVLCDPGDTVLCESPSFIGALNSFRSHSINLIGIETDSAGIIPESLENALKSAANVRMLYTIPTFQNPKGVTMTLERRKKILELCKNYNVILLEDNPYGDLYYDNAPPDTIKSLDDTGTVVYVGSFSKTISPGLRLGYVAANASIVEKIVVAKQGEDVHTALFPQVLAHEYLTNYDFDAHIAECRSVYRRKRDLMVSACEKYLGADIIVPGGGLFLWGSLRDTDDSMPFYRRALERKVALVAGGVFLPDTEAVTPGFRLNFSMPSDEQIEKGIKILGELL
ncbi:MAG: PLP-dependent aminotransferase family protein [Oscillospiraceae bacterium]|nr:PLP-dependent aminotransferase family protein [Oscillospiraceae bacterium]